MRARVAETLLRAREGASLLPVVAKDANALRAFVGATRRTWIAAVLWLVLGFALWPSIHAAIGSVVTPREQTRGFFSRRSRPHPLEEEVALSLDLLYWLGGSLTLATVLLAHVPGFVRARREGLPMDRTVHADDAHGAVPASAPSGALRESVGGSDGKRYRLARELGRGGMGVVHLGHDTVLDRPVAVKELPSGLFGAKELIDRFRVEARALAKLAHPGIVQVYDLVEEPNGMFMAMELVEGGDLDQRIEASGAMPAEEVARLGVALAEALRFAHERGVVHRDFKPQNVLMTPEGQPKITDFGIAKLAQGPKLTQTGAVMGTPAYMSPEQASGMVVDTRTDVYALGITLYELATGKVPFEGETAAVLVQHLTETPAAPNVRGAALPEPIEALILRMLTKEPAARPTLPEVEATLRAGTI